MKLETRLLLVIGAILTAVFAFEASVAYKRARDDAMAGLERQADSLRAALMATRRVYQQALVGSGLEWNEATLPLLPAHAMGRISADFANWTDSGVTFNNVSDRPRNPRNRADAIELRAIERFRSRPDLDKLILPFTGEDGAAYYLYARPIAIEPYCLQCHGPRSEAPAVIAANYAEGYDYQIGDLRGILSIKLPAEHLHAQALAQLPAHLGMLLAVLLAAFLGFGAVIRRHVRRPLQALTQGMQALAAGDYARRVDGLHGEFAEIAGGFNAMAEEIPHHHDAIRRLSAAVEQSSASIVMTDLQGRIVYVNRRFTEVTGYAAEEVIGGSPRILKSGHMDASAYARLWETISAGGEWRGEFLNRRKDGTLFWERALIAPVRDAEGRIERYLGVKEDVTAHKQAQQAAQEADQRLGRILESTGEGIFGLDRAGRCTFINPAGLRMLGYAADADLLGRSIHDLIHHSHADGTRMPVADCRAMLAMLCGQPDHVADEVFWRQDGTSFPVEYRAHPIIQDGEVVGGVVSFTDITERQEAERTMRAMVDQLVRSNIELERFAYVASHDLQEPLRSISGYAQLLERRYRDRLDADANTFIDFMVGATKRMQTLINDLLAYSRVQSRGGALRPVEANAALQQALLNLSDALERGGGMVCVDCLPPVNADEMQLVQLFQNLVGNAVKFTRPDAPPRVTVTAQRRGERWEFMVSDNGIGIAPEHHARIFDVFQRLHTGTEYPGTGIGLAVCKRIVERHGGTIGVESTPGGGATFRFDLAAG